MTETDSRAWRDVEWIKQERQVLQDYLAETPREEQSFQGWYNYAYILRGLPLFDGCMSEEVFNEIREMQPAQAKRKKGRPQAARLSEDEAAAREEREQALIEAAKETIMKTPEYAEAVKRGWLVGFDWTNKAPVNLATWLVTSGIVVQEDGPLGRIAWRTVDRVFTWKGGKPITASTLKSMKR